MLYATELIKFTEQVEQSNELRQIIELYITYQEVIIEDPDEYFTNHCYFFKGLEKYLTVITDSTLAIKQRFKIESLIPLRVHLLKLLQIMRSQKRVDK